MNQILKLALKKFTYKLILITAFLALLGTVFFYFFPNYFLLIMPFLLIFVALLTFGVFYTIIRGLEKRTVSSFNTYFTGANGIKLFLFIIFLSVYLFINPDKAILFSVTFVFLYIVYTFFEVYHLVKLVKKLSKKS